MDTQKLLTSRLCPHRGKGEENTVRGITAAIADKPFMVEFDVQWFQNNLYLGHPPQQKMGESLESALALFSDTKVMPKVDLKLPKDSFDEALHFLCDTLVSSSLEKILVNIGGQADTMNYMKAEKILLAAAPHNILLNIDLRRYEEASLQVIDEHVISLARKPVSLSPNLEDDIAQAIDFALYHDIPHVHYWAHPHKKYSTEQLIDIMIITEKRGLSCYFDIGKHNIIVDEPDLVWLQ